MAVIAAMVQAELMKARRLDSRRLESRFDFVVSDFTVRVSTHFWFKFSGGKRCLVTDLGEEFTPLKACADFQAMPHPSQSTMIKRKAQLSIPIDLFGYA